SYRPLGSRRRQISIGVSTKISRKRPSGKSEAARVRSAWNGETRATMAIRPGTQYACSDYTEVLAAHDITASMSRVGNPYDNAKAERFMRTLKTEQIDGTLYRDRHAAERSIGDFIERIYNKQRLHTALDYRSPAQFEAWHRARVLPGVGDAALDKGSATPTPNLPPDPHTRRAP